MHLALDEDTELLQRTAFAFAKDRVRPHARAWDEGGALDEAALAEGWELGLLAAGIPERHGGYAEDDAAAPRALAGAVALEALCWGDLGYALALFAPAHLAVPVALFGTDAEKAEFLPLCAAGTPPRATAAWIEPHRTFDLGAVRTQAAPELTGHKALVPGGAASELTLVYARAASAQGFDGMGAFLVRGKNPGGLSRRAREEVMGPLAAPTHRLVLEGCEAARLGGGRGVDYRTLAARALTASAAAAIGVGRAAAEYAKDYAKERQAFGRPIAQYQSIAFKIADAYTDLEAARWMTWKAAWRLDRGDDALAEASRAFRFATDAAWRAADDGVQILGGHGVIRDHLAELFFRNARALAGTPGWLMV